MRRKFLLASVAGGIVGSWLTLVAVQFGGYGFSLPGRGHATTTEYKSTTAAPPETAKAEPTLPKAMVAPKPVETTRPDEVTSGKSQPENPPVVQPANLTPKNKETVLAAASSSTKGADSSPELSATAMAAAATATPVGNDTEKAPDGKVPTDPAGSNDASTKLEEAQAAPAVTDAAENTASPSTPQPTETTPDKASAAAPGATLAKQATDPLPNNRIPADQIDREMAAAAHRTIPSLPQPQDKSKPESEQASLGPVSQPRGQTTTIELMRPFADQAGILTLAGRSVQLGGIIPTDVDRMCTGPNGKSWPCGQAARTAFRMYLRGRSIDCDVPDPAWKGTVKGECRYVRVDLGSWLVRFGWADPEPGSPLAALVDEAKEKKRGMYGDDPRKNGKSTLGPPLPKEDPLNPI